MFLDEEKLCDEKEVEEVGVDEKGVLQATGETHAHLRSNFYIEYASYQLSPVKSSCLYEDGVKET